MLLITLLLSGCGPTSSATTEEEQIATTQKIALDYQNHHNLTQANSELEALDVANLNQWLLYVTETAVTNNVDGNTTTALVLLATDLGLQSNAIHAYALQHNLVASALALQPEVLVTVQTTPEAVAAASQADVVTILSDPANDNAKQSAESAPVISDTLVTTRTDVVTTSMIITSGLSSPVTPTVTATPTPTLALGPQAVAASAINVRIGPGTEYTVVGSLQQSETVNITGKNAAGDWWEILLPTGQSGWVYGALVETAGDINAVALAANIPTPPPTPIPAPTQPAAPPAEQPAPPADQPPPAPGGPDFRVVGKRLWEVVENGGQLNGSSVTCGEKRQLVVEVLDANGNRLNGVAVQAIYGAQEIIVSGSQGKGDGISEFVLGSGQALKVVRDADGREVTSEEVYNLSTKPAEIPFETLIGAHFCTDEASCKSFVYYYGCGGHYSWTVKFQRSY